MKYGLIGVGNMGGALATALCRSVDPETVLLANRTQEKATALAEQLHCRVSTNEEIAQHQQFRAVVERLEDLGQ